MLEIRHTDHANPIGKVRAALEARVDPQLSIIARTNAGVLPTEAVIERTLAYQQAGADIGSKTEAVSTQVGVASNSRNLRRRAE
jgi:2-methylisocitrate lyase-like PEP mutase family enzyme